MTRRDMIHFYKAYERLVEKGVLDTPMGEEYQRLLHEWDAAGRPDNVLHFLYCRANAGPYGKGPDPWQ